jgi:hypothetical protein
MDMTRTEHLEWAKKRAIEYVEQNDLMQAFDSIVSDLRKHPELQEHVGIELGIADRTCGFLNTPRAMRDFIKGFN